MAVIKSLSYALLLFAMALSATDAGADAADGQGTDAGNWTLFGTREIRNTSLDAFRKWTGMLARHRRSAETAMASRSGRCKPNPRFPCPRAEWEAFMDRARDMPPDRQIRATNRFLNRAPYIIDPVNWGVEDYWATPGEFLSRDGDCEDYAISKYLTLKALGFKAETMRVVILNDENLDTAHAVLAIAFEGDILILDNQISRVIDAAQIYHYRPIYSINETGWWYHVGWQGLAQSPERTGLPKAGFN